MISGKQIRAARALLDLKQETLAKRTGLSKVSLHKIERGLVTPHKQTLEKIITLLENEGVTFQGDDGVRLKNDIFESKVFEGEVGSALFFDHIIRSLKSVTKEERIVYWLGDNNRAELRKQRTLFQYYKRLVEIDGKEKILTNKTSKTFYGPPQTTEYYHLNNALDYKEDREKKYGEAVYPTYFFTAHNYKKFHVIENKAFFTACQRSIKATCRDSKPITPERILYFEDLERWG